MIVIAVVVVVTMTQQSVFTQSAVLLTLLTDVFSNAIVTTENRIVSI